MQLYKRGNIYWCKFRIDNKVYRYSCKTKDKSVAQEVAAAIHGDAVRKKFDIPVKYKMVKSFSELFSNYLKTISNLPSTVNRKIAGAKHFLPVFNNIDIKKITQLDIEKYQAQRKKEIIAYLKNIDKREQEISFKSINNEILILSNFFNYCIKYNYLDKNPASGIKKLNELSRLKTLSDSDIDELIAGATNKLTRDLITFLIYTGCRKGEALNLKWDDVDMQNDVIAIKGTKTKYDRYIPISRALKRILEGINRESVYVFSYRGKKLSNFRESFKTACKRAGLNGLRVHDLRHVFASKMVMSGTSLYITGELLGHRTPQMTMRYAHLAPYTLKKAVDEVWG